jgi:hypothetical protein
LANRQTSEENLASTLASQKVIAEIHKLNEISRKLIEKVEQTTTYSAAEHLQSGRLNLKLSPERTSFKFQCGRLSFIAQKNNFIGSLEQVRTGYTDIPFGLNFKDNELRIKMEVFDLDGKLIAKIDGDKWRLFSNYVGAFNYDAKGFELLDSRGNVAVNLNIGPDDSIVIQGLFVGKYYLGGRGLVAQIAGPKTGTTVALKRDVLQWDLPSGGGFEGNKDCDLFDFLEKVDHEIHDKGAKKIFIYTGNNWLGKRSKI